jgi:hypothetical protein
MDSGTDDDASVSDAGTDAELDAGDGDEEDAGDSGSEEPACGEVKASGGSYLGNSCASVVTCQDPEPAATNDYVEACVLIENDAPKSRCCVGNPPPKQTCRAENADDESAAVGPCDVEAACDGPEDCEGYGPGANYCCINNFKLESNAVGCSDNPCGDEERTLCHKDGDCPTGYRCAAGFDYDFGVLNGGKQRVAKWWGFCVEN